MTGAHPDAARLFQPPRLVAMMLVVSSLLSCGPQTALDLKIYADPKYNSEEALVAALGAVRLVVDSEEGLYAGSMSRQGDGFVIQNVDSDAPAELLSTVDMAGLDRLPRIRLERGGLSDAPLELRVDGVAKDSGQAIAAYGIKGITFTDGSVQEVPLPLTLKAEFRPPTVDQVYPPDGTTGLTPSSLRSVLVIFSKRMNPELLEKTDAFQVVSTASGAPVAVLRIDEQPYYPGGPSVAELVFAAPLDLDTTYEVIVWPKARDIAGNALDCVPLEQGNQEFRSRFSTAPTQPASAPACAPNCESTWCGSGGTSCPEGLTCEAVTGFCVVEGCGPGCPDGLVCDPALPACVPDCRMHGTYGGCPADRICNDDGLCVEPAT